MSWTFLKRFVKSTLIVTAAVFYYEFEIFKGNLYK